MTEDQAGLPKIDRWHSAPMDVHKWSEHHEIKSLSDRLYSEVGINALDRSGNRKGKKSAYQMLRVLLVDLYARWLHDPTLATGFSKNKNDYQVNSRYNKVFISRKIIQVEKLLEDEGYIDGLPGYNDRTGKGDNYITRIRPSEKLQNEFEQISATLYDIDYHVDRQLIILRKRYEDETEQVQKRNIEYQDTDYTNRIREQLEAYNALLKQTFIDIPSLEEPFVRRLIETGKRAGREIKISIGPENKHVHRVFNGTEDDNWSKGGRFYGGWWLQIPKELRKDIYINDQPTVEIDFKAMHPSMLMATSAADPYLLEHLVLPDLIPDAQQQRDTVKSLILMAINANNANSAFAAFRNAKKKRDPLKRLTNEQLQALLDAFTCQYPELGEVLNTGQALRLMNRDSQIANLVIDYFTQKSIPVLCIHDSFIIQDNKQEELAKVLEAASKQIEGKAFNQDTKSNGNEIPTFIKGNIDGYQTGRNATIKIPNKVKPTEQYELRKTKYYKWIEQSESKQGIER